MQMGESMKKITMMAMMLVLCIGLVACKNNKETMASPTNEPIKETSKPISEDTTEEETENEAVATEEPQVEVDKIVTDKTQIVGMANEILNNMTLEEKIGQLFVVNFEQLDTRKKDTYNFTKVTATMREALKKYKVGGVIFFATNIETPAQTTKFINKLQGFSTVPMFISVDEEGGDVARIANNEKMNTTSFPTMEIVGAMANEDYAFDMGQTIGKEIKGLGFNLDFAPVADVRTNELNTEIGNRSFGDDQKLVAKKVSQVVCGLQSENVAATLKHFPGQGSTAGDSHKGAVDVDSDINELRKVSFVPFKAGIKAGVDVIMVSHLSISNVTGSTKPASMTELVMKDILRTELSFEGVIITDAMNMKSVTKYYTPGEAAVNAISAGADMVLMPENFVAAYNAVCNAVSNGTIDEKTIDEKVQRILELKIKRGIILSDTNLLTASQEN